MDPWMEEALEAGTLFFDAKRRPVALPAPPSPVADTHAHASMLAPKELEGEERLEAVAAALARSWLSGVTWVISIVDASEDGRDPHAFLSWLSRVEEATHATIEQALAAGLPAAFPHEPFKLSLSAGIHPYGAEAALGEGIGALAALTADRRCIALGECGLDYHCELDRAIQREGFRRQLALAADRGLPLELHVRDASDDRSYEAHAEALEIVRAAGVALLGIDLHCYTLGPEPLVPWVELGACVAFGGALTFKRSEEIRDAAAACPLDAFITETDSPYMAPEPLRGQPSEPAFTVATANCMAQVRGDVLGEGRSEVFAAAWENAHRLFRV